VRKIGEALRVLYVVGVIATLPYFNWQYARDHGFLRWLFFGELVATAEALIWPAPLAIDALLKRLERREAERFLLVAAAALRAGQLDSRDEILKYRRAAVTLGDDISPRVLNGIYPELGTMFREKFIKSLELGNRAAETRDPALSQEANRLENEWRSWLRPREVGVSAAIKKRVPSDAFRR
jgi:hypothetical protein